MRSIGVALALAGATAATAATFAPWGRSGEASRSSYQLVEIAGRAGVVPDWASAFTPLWYVVPILCGLAFIAAAAGRPRSVGTVCSILGALVVLAAVLVSSSPLVTESGAVAGGLAGAVTIVIGAAIVVAPRPEVGEA